MGPVPGDDWRKIQSGPDSHKPAVSDPWLYHLLTSVYVSNVGLEVQATMAAFACILLFIYEVTQGHAQLQVAMTDPTVDPTAEPTVEPTVMPSMEPTMNPTTEPTGAPTPRPTDYEQHPLYDSPSFDDFESGNDHPSSGMLILIVILCVGAVFVASLLLNMYLRGDPMSNKADTELTTVEGHELMSSNSTAATLGTATTQSPGTLTSVWHWMQEWRWRMGTND